MTDENETAARDAVRDAESKLAAARREHAEARRVAAELRDAKSLTPDEWRKQKRLFGLNN